MTALPAQQAKKSYPVNQVEANVPPYQLPDPLLMKDGSRVQDVEGWKKRKAELKEWFDREMFGRTPKFEGTFETRVLQEFPIVLKDGNGKEVKAIRRHLELVFEGAGETRKLPVLLYLPEISKSAPVPAIIGMNFKGNHAIESDEAIPISETANKAARGEASSRWSIGRIVGEGFALASFCYLDAARDSVQLYRLGIRATFGEAPTQDPPGTEEWSVIGTWAWTASRVLDSLQQQPEVDAKRVAIFGHSRLGKTSLWAGVQDERFAAVISNNSGAGGAALSKRIFGETTAILNQNFPHWFTGNYKKYTENEAAMETDQHELIALVAPRPVYVASAEEDLWADPRGEWLSLHHAEPVYQLFYPELSRMKDPQDALTETIGTVLAYHKRAGKHDVTDLDWKQYLAWAKSTWAK